MLPILIPAHLSVFIPCQINTADKASREGEEKGEGEGEGEDRGKTVAAALCLKFNIVVVILRDSPSTEGHTHTCTHIRTYIRTHHKCTYQLCCTLRG